MQEVLVACLHEDPERIDSAALNRLGEADWRELLRLATFQRVRPLVYQRLADRKLRRDVPPYLWEALEQAARQTAVRVLRGHAELAALAAALAAERIPLIVLKGAHLVQVVYENPALREMGDIDVLVRREHLHRATEVVLARGYAPLHPFQVDRDADVRNHVARLVKPKALAVEVHWNITVPGCTYSVDPAPLWRRAVPVRIAGTPMLGLSPEDLLLHLCVHAAYQHWFELGLAPLCDIAATVRRFENVLDWPAVQQQCRAWKWERGVHLVLHLAKELVGARVPDAVLACLSTREDRAVATTARMQIFAGAPRPPENYQLAELRTLPGLRAKMRHLRRRIFIPRSEMAMLYAIPPGARGISLFYVVRLYGLLRRNSGPAARQLMRQPQLTALAARRALLRSWLSEA